MLQVVEVNLSLEVHQILQKKQDQIITKNKCIAIR